MDGKILQCDGRGHHRTNPGFHPHPARLPAVFEHVEGVAIVRRGKRETVGETPDFRFPGRPFDAVMDAPARERHHREVVQVRQRLGLAGQHQQRTGRGVAHRHHRKFLAQGVVRVPLAQGIGPGFGFGRLGGLP